MKTINITGIDIAKNIFQLHGADKHGKEIFKKKVKRNQLVKIIGELPECIIGMEACGGAHYWARVFSKMGHQVRLISPQYVKPYVRGNKTDRWDAEAIAEAVSRPRMNFVGIKDVCQQEIQSIHRVRSRRIRERTAISNEIRGLLHEFGIVMAKGIGRLKKEVPFIISNKDNELMMGMRELLEELLEELWAKERQIAVSDRKVKRVFKNDERCQRIEAIEGIGEITATAIVAACGDAKAFKNGRQFSAWLGLVPKQRGTGGDVNLLRISKRGDKYLRTLLIHGARAVLRVSTNKTDSRSRWIEQKKIEKGWNKASVALANKNARIIWALLSKEENYRKAA